MPDSPQHQEAQQGQVQVDQDTATKISGGIVPIDASTDQYNEAYWKLHPPIGAGGQPLDPEKGSEAPANWFMKLLTAGSDTPGKIFNDNFASKVLRGAAAGPLQGFNAMASLAQNAPGLREEFEAGGLGPGARGEPAKKQVVPQESIDFVLGPAKGTKVAEISSDISRFVVLLAITPEIAGPKIITTVISKGPKAIQFVLGATNLALRAGTIKAVAFEQSEAHARGLVMGLIGAIPGLEDIGGALDVDADMGIIEARLKAGASEALDWFLIDSLLAQLVYVKAVKGWFAAEPKSAARLRQEKKIDAAEVKINKMLEGEAPAGDAVKVVETPDGANIVVNQASPFGKSLPEQLDGPVVIVKGKRFATGRGTLHSDAWKEAEKEFSITEVNEAKSALGSGDKFLTTKGRVVDRDEGTKLIDELNKARKARKEAGEQAKKEGDISTPSVDEALAAPPGELKFVGEEAVGEARQQSAAINNEIREQVTQNVGGKLTQEQADKVRAFAKELIEAAANGDVAAIARLSSGTHFNFSSANNVDEVLALIEGLSEQFGAEFVTAMKKGGIGVEETINQVRRTMRGMTDAEAPAALIAKLKQFEGQSVVLLVSDVVMKEYGQKVVRISAALDARPKDAVLHETARRYITIMFELAKKLAGANSETGRALRFMQERGVEELAQLKFATRTKAVAERAKVAREKSGRDIAKAEKAAKTGEEELATVRKEQARAPRDPAAQAGAPRSSRGRKQEAGDIASQEEAFAKIIQQKVKANKALDKKLKAEKAKGKELGVAADEADLAAIKAVADEGGTTVAGMSFAEIRSIAKLVRMGGGDPLAMHAIARGTGIILKEGWWNKVLEVFLNNLLSGPPTWVAVAVSGVGTSVLEPTFRVMAGTVKGNKALQQEGIDLIVGLARSSKDGWKAFQAAMRAGHNITRGVPTTQAIGGLTGTLFRLSGRIMASIDEFLFVTNYRSYVRAKALRLARDDGLVDEAAEAFAEQVTGVAFHPVTGIARLQEGIQYAEKPLFASPLGKFSAGGKAQQIINEYPVLKIIAPFIRATINLNRYAAEGTPVVNLYSKRVRAAFREGGEEAAIIHAREAVTGMFLAGSLGMYLAGNLTGRGPSDPALRKVWDLDNKPYSIRGSKNMGWHDISRLQPISLPIMILADLLDAASELGPEFLRGERNVQDVEQIMASFFVGMTTSIANKQWLDGLTNFMSAWTENNAFAATKWLTNLARAFVPAASLVRVFNPDDFFREPHGLVEMLLRDIPGFSETLSPHYNILGQPEMKTPSWASRAFVPSKFSPAASPAKRIIVDAMEEIQRGFSQVSDELLDAIDLRDDMWKSRDGQQRPWDRLNELIREGFDGRKGMEAALVEMIQSDRYRDASPGSLAFPGGKRFALVAAVKGALEARALKKLMEEYPKIKSAFVQIKRAQGEAMKDDTGFESLSDLFDQYK